MNPDILRMSGTVIDLVRAFDKAGQADRGDLSLRPGCWPKAGIIRGRVVTGWPSIRTDLTNAGGAGNRPEGRGRW